MASLQIEALSKRFGQTAVLNDINLDAQSGEFVVLVGPSGCGKSTLLSTIAGLEAPSSGEISIGGERVTSLRPRERDIAMVFQSYALYPTMTVAKNLSFGMETRGVPKATREAAVQRVAEMLQIEPLLNRRPAQLSGGQRQRVAMGRALVRDPKVFLFDEPLSNLDAKLRVEMRTEIKKLHQRLGTTVVYVTHDQVEAMTLATRIAVMNEGVVQQYARPETIYNAPANMFVAGFMGSPAMNFLHGVVTAGEGGRHWLEVQGADGQSLPFPLPQAGPALQDRVGQPAVLGLRPEHLTSLEAAEDGADAAQARYHPLTGTVSVVEPTGPDTMMMIDVGGHEVMARVRPDEAVAPGAQARFGIDLHKACVFDSSTGDRLN